MSTDETETRAAPAADELQVPATFTDVLGYHLRIAQEASFQAIRQAAGTELKPGWYTILTILAETGGLTPSELSRRCGRDRSTLTATLKALSARGLIERQRNPDDQRSYRVILTSAGIAMQDRLHEVARRHDRRLDEIVGADKAVVLAALRRIVVGLGLPVETDPGDLFAAAEDATAPSRRRSGFVANAGAD